MATAAEMGLRPGDIAVSLTARKNEHGGTIGGLNLDYPGAQILYDVIKVTGVDVPSPVVYGTGSYTAGILLQTNDPGHLDGIGKEIAIDNGFHNYYIPTDERLQGQLDRSGWYLEEQISPEGEKRVSLQRRNSKN